jgi:hypothetical protein
MTLDASVQGASLAQDEDLRPWCTWVEVDPFDNGMPAVYTVKLELEEDLSAGLPDPDSVRITFPQTTGFTSPYVPGSILVWTGEDWDAGEPGMPASFVTITDLGPSGIKYEIPVPYDIPENYGDSCDHDIVVQFTLAAGMINPITPGAYRLKLSTSEQVGEIESRWYNIIQPGKVHFFLKYMDPLEACCGVRYKYMETFQTIQSALDEANRYYLTDLHEGMEWVTPWTLFTSDDGAVPCGYSAGLDPWGPQGWGHYPWPIGAKILVTDGVYKETIVIDTPGIEVVSENGAAATTIDAFGIDPSTRAAHYFEAPPAAVQIVASAVTFKGFTVKDAGVVAPRPLHCPDVNGDGFCDANGITYVPINPKDYAVVDGPQQIIHIEKNPHVNEPWGQGWAPADNADHVPNDPWHTPNQLDDWFGLGPWTTARFPVWTGRVNILENVIVDAKGHGVETNAWTGNFDYPVEGDRNPVILIANNEIFEDGVTAPGEDPDSGYDGVYLDDAACGVEVIDPAANTHGTCAATEVLRNSIHNNGAGATGDGYPFDDYEPDEEEVGSGIEVEESEEGCPMWGAVPLNNQADPCSGKCKLYIKENIIFENEHAGILLQDDAAKNLVIIQKNDIHDNGAYGIGNLADTYKCPLKEPAPPPECPPGDPCENDAGLLYAGDDNLIVNVDCKYNNIYGNVDWGVKNFQPYAHGDDHPDEGLWFDAKENYWGQGVGLDADGRAVNVVKGPLSGGPSKGPKPAKHEPSQESKALGYGDAVSHWVYYNPWLSVPFGTVLSSGIRYYGSDTLALQKGWNTLSVPIPLHSLANELAEIAGLGSFIDGMTLAWQYNPDTGIYVVPTALQAARGYFVRMKGSTRFPVLYDNQFNLAAYTLEPNSWNLIGAAFGIDRAAWADQAFWPLTDWHEGQGRWAVASPDGSGADGVADFEGPHPGYRFDPNEATMQVELALDSVKNNASVIISPNMPGQIEAWSSSFATEAGSGQRVFYTGEAYWLFMSGPGTLAGYEAAPLYLP